MMQLRIDWRGAIALGVLAVVCGTAGAQSTKVNSGQEFQFPRAQTLRVEEE